jgi:putative spermidine/putrescine transport system permease protein
MVALRTASRKRAGTGTGERAGRPGRAAGRRRRSGWSWFWLAFAAVYLLVPLYSTLQFSLQTGAHRYGLSWYGYILNQPAFRQSFALSLRLALETVVISLVLMIPTVYLVHAWLPKLRPLMEFICTLPFVVPPIALAVGMIGLFQGVPRLISSTQILSFAYVIQALPFTYRSLDAGMLSIDIRTLNDAAQSVGASWRQTLWSVILPNLRSAILSSAFLTIAIVLGEFTISSLLLFNTFAVYMQQIGNSQAYAAAALAILSFFLTWLAMLGIFFISRRVGYRSAVGMTR